jgi:MFS family permease
MDHAGAVAGPLLASAFLYFYPGDYRTLFALTIVPGVIVILVLLRVPGRAADPARGSAAAGGAVSRPGPQLQPRHRPGPQFWGAMAVILVFSLGNATDAFLLLRLSDLGVPTFWIPLLWSALHIVKVTSSLAGGALSDRLGRRTLIGAGWLCYAGIYGGFGLFGSTAAVVTLFLAYGVYFGFTEGVEKAWVADMAPPDARGTAFGIYNAVLGVGTLAASLLFGFIWTRVSPEAAFFTGAGLALSATALLPLVRPR